MTIAPLTGGLLLLAILAIAVPGNAAAGPLGYWPLDEGSGTTTADASGNGHPGTLVNTPAWTSGKVGGALNFSGTTSYVSINGAGSLANLPASGMTVSAWIKPNSAGSDDDARIISKGDGSKGWFINFDSASTLFFGSDTYADAPTNRYSTSVISFGVWQHVVVTWDGSTNGNNVHFYINGVLADGASTTGAGAVQDDSSLPLSIGNRTADATREFDGLIDEVRVYNQVLSAAQVQALAADTQVPSTPGSLTASAVSGSQINLGWSASSDSAGVTGYRVERCSGASCSNFTQIATPTTTSYSDTGLTASTSYTYRVRALDAQSFLSSYSSTSTAMTSAGADTTPPTAPSGVSATAVSASQINLTWTASTDNVGVTGYKVERCQGAGCSSFTQVSTPSGTTFNDTGLSASTSYSYRVRATDAATNLSGYSSTAGATTSGGGGGASPPLGYWPLDEGSGTTTADASGNGHPGTLVNTPAWTSGKIGGALNFSGSTSYVSINGGGSLANLPASGMTVSAWIKPNSAGSDDDARIISKGDGSKGWFINFDSASTLFFGSDTYADAPTNRYSTSVISFGVWQHVVVTWDGSANGNNVHFYINGVLADGASTTGAGAVQDDSSLPLSIGNRTADATREFDGLIDEVRVYNQVLSAAQVQALAADTQVPSTPGSLTTTVASGSQINLIWSASSDSVGVTGYRVERCSGVSCTNFTQIATPTTTSYSDTGLTASTSYTYRVRALDAQSFLSSYSSTSNATTSAGGDTTPPTPPTGLTATATSSSQINLSWTASTDNVGVTGYKVERCQGAGCSSFTQVGTPSGTTFNDTGLSAFTSYSYQVRATDAAGNLGAYSSTANVTTSGSSASIAYVQSGVSTQPSATSGSVTFSTAQSGGDLNVLMIGWTDSNSQVPLSVTDTRGNTYTLAVGPTWSGPNAEAVYYAKNIVVAGAGVNTVTVTFNTIVASLDIRAAEYSGIDTSNPLDGGAGGVGTALAISSGPVTTTNANDLLVAGVYLSHNAMGPGLGYTQRQFTPFLSTLEDEIVSSTGSYAGTAQQNAIGSWVMVMAAFRAANGGSDTTPPTAPSGLISPVTSSTQVNLRWTKSTDNVGVTKYLVERCLGAGCGTFAQVATSASPLYIDTTVSPATTYGYRVRATDAGGNLGGYSNTVAASTAAASVYPCSTTGPATACYFYDDTGRLKIVQRDDGAQRTYLLDAAGNRLSTTRVAPTPAGIPTVLTVVPHSSTSMSLAWNAPNGGNQQFSYTVYRDGQAIAGSITATSMIDTGLSPNTTYGYTVSARDSEGNQSAQSAPASNKTYSNPVITSFTVSATSATSLAISWTATDTNGPSGSLTYSVTGAAGPLSGCTSSPCSATGLTAGTNHAYTLTATDSAGDSVSSSANGTTYQLPVIQSFSATPTSSSAMTLSWTASDVGGSGGLTYSVVRGSTPVPGCTVSGCSDTGLLGGGTYTYTLTATDSTTVDKATATASGTTFAAVPSVPANLHGSPGISPNGSYSVIWDAATGAVVAYYNLLENGTTVYTITAPDTFKGFQKSLVTGDVYHYQVRACTSANVCSAYSTQSDVMICKDRVCP